MDRILKWLASIPAGPVVGAVVVAGLWLLSGMPQAEHRVPDLHGLQVNPAIARAVEEGFFTKVRFRSGGGVAGTVIGQAPDPRQIRDKGTRVTLVVTKGAAQVRVPDVRGVPVEEARRRLDRGNLTPGAVTFEDGGRTGSDRVIRTSPAAGRLVDVDTRVDLIAAH